MFDKFDPLAKITFRLCQITNIDLQKKVVGIKDYYTSQALGEVPLLHPVGFQFIPKGSEIILVAFMGGLGRRIVSIWQGVNDLPILRPQGTIEQGEVCISSHGGGYAYLDNSGNVSLSSLGGLSKLTLGLIETKLISPNIILKTDFGAEITTTKDSIVISKKENNLESLIELTNNTLKIKTTNNQNINCSIEFNSNGNLLIKTNGSIDLDAKGSIMLGGSESVVVAPGLPGGVPISDLSQLAVSSKVKAGK